MESHAFGGTRKPLHKRAKSEDIDASILIEREKLSRQLATRLAPIGRPQDCPLFEHFLVFGEPPSTLDPNASHKALTIPTPSSSSFGSSIVGRFRSGSNKITTDPIKPAVLFQYPADTTLTLQALEQFVFPTGVPSLVEYKDLKKLAPTVREYHTLTPTTAFTLLLTTAVKEVFYAMCIQDEYLKEFPTFVPTPANNNNNNNNTSSPQNKSNSDNNSETNSNFSDEIDDDSRINTSNDSIASYPTSPLEKSTPYSEGTKSSPTLLTRKSLTPSGRTGSHPIRPTSQPITSSSTQSKTTSPDRSNSESIVNKNIRNSRRSSSTSSTSSSTSNIHYPTGAKVYCIITRYPFFDLMYDILLYLLDVEEKSLTLPLEYRRGELNQVNRILEHLWRVKPPGPGETVKLGIPRIMDFVRPKYKEDETLIANHCVPCMFWQFDRDTILGLIGAALIERKLLFVSSNLRLLSNCILSFIAFLRPFVLQCVFIPVLPDSLIHIAEAPVPFIAGVANSKLLNFARQLNPELIVVDLDGKRVYCPEEVHVPPLPNSKQLAHAIDPYVMQLKKTFDKHTPPFKPTKIQRDLTTELMRLLEQYITPYFESFRRHCVTSLTDNVTVFFSDSFLQEETTPQSAEFWNIFMETQVFQHWCDKKLKEIDAQRMERFALHSQSVSSANPPHINLSSSGNNISSSINSSNNNSTNTKGSSVSLNLSTPSHNSSNTSLNVNVLPNEDSTATLASPLPRSPSCVKRSMSGSLTSLYEQAVMSRGNSSHNISISSSPKPQTRARSFSQSNESAVAGLMFDMSSSEFDNLGTIDE